MCICTYSFFVTISLAYSQAVPVIKDGEAQIVEAFDTPDKWIRHDLWVETEFDTDGDGKPDRMHVSVTRPYQTDSEKLKLPVYMMMNKWLSNFTVRTELNIGVFALPIIGLILLLLFIIRSTVLRAARANPVDSLRDE